uniref:Uncharacterized protein n=1 Tax=viral metagenome TaxID=1070528 RepID=A0A6M3IK82_9ZZZZ
MRLKKAFRKTLASCKICGDDVTDKYMIGGDFYCSEHYETESTAEKLGNENLERIRKEFKKVFQ